MKKEFEEISLKLSSKSSFLKITKEIKDKIDYLIIAFNVIAAENSFNDYFESNQENQIKKFFKNILPSIISNVLELPSINDETGRDIIIDFLISIIRFLSKDQLNKYPEILNLISNIFINEKKYKYFTKDVKKFWQFNNEFCNEFKNNQLPYIFKKGDKVDVLVENSNEDEQYPMIWMEGIINKIENGIYTILYNGANDKNNEIEYPIGFPTVRERNYNWDWTLDLKKDELVYAYYRGEWISCKIADKIEETEKNGIKRIKYRINKDYQDEGKTSYTQSYYNNSDEDQVYHFFIKKYENNKNKEEIKQEIFNELNEIKQELDDIILYKKDNRNNIIVGKFYKFDYNFAKILKQMETENLFDDFLNILDSDNSEIIPEAYFTIYDIFISAFDYLHTDFIKEKKQIFKKGFFNLLKKYNINYNKLKKIKYFLKNIWKKTQDSFDEIEKEIILIKETDFINDINSNKLPYRITGFKNMNEKIVIIDEADFAKELKNLNIIEKIFGEGYHKEIIKNSENILEFMNMHNALNEGDIKLIWSCIKDCTNKRELDTKNYIFKILGKLIEKQDEDFFEILINEIVADKHIPDDIEIEFLKKLSEKPMKNKFKICQYYFNILVDKNNLDISNNFFAENLKDLALKDDNLFNELFELYKDNIDKKTNCLLSYQLITELLKKKGLSEKEKISLKTIFEEDFKNYFDEIKRIANTNINDVDKINHKNNISIRLNFLYELTRLYEKYNFTSLLKSYLIEDPIFPDDYNYIFEFLEKYCSNENNEINEPDKNRNDILIEFYDILIKDSNEKIEKIYSYEQIKIFLKLLYYKYNSDFDLNIIDNINEENYEIKLKSKQNKEIIFEKLWNFLFKVSEEKSIRILMNIILQMVNEKEVIYKINDQLDELDYDYEPDIKIVERCYKILKIFFIETEKYLSINIKTHFSLLKNCIIKLPLELKNKESDLREYYIECFYGNSSLNEIKEYLTKKFGIHIKYIDTYVQKDNKQILLDYTYNNKTIYEILEEFYLINNQNYNIFKNPMKNFIYFSAKEKEELIKNNDLSPKLKEILGNSFYQATKGKKELEPRNFKNFFDKEIKQLFERIQQNQPEKKSLTKEDIFKYYFKIISGDDKRKKDFVEKLKNAGFDKYLIKKEGNASLEYQPVHGEELFRYFLSEVKNDSNNNFFNDFIFNYNHINPKIDYNLFFFLPTSKYHYEKLLKYSDDLKDEINNIFINDENKILMQLYYLIIIESFLQDIESNYIELNNIYKKPDNNKNHRIHSKDYLFFDEKENIENKIYFVEKFITGNNYSNLIEYAINLMNNKTYEKDKLHYKCLVKSLRIIKILYSAFISKNNVEIKKEKIKEKNIYYFDYRYINIKFRVEENLKKIISDLSFSNLVQVIFNYIISNYNNDIAKNKLLFGECFELIILLISSNEKYFSEKEIEQKKSTFSNFIEEELISNSYFIIEKILFSLNNVLAKPSESIYIEFLYNIFFSIYSKMSNRIFQKEINSEEYFELFVEFNKFIYTDETFDKKGIIRYILEILINDMNVNDKIHLKILSDEMLLKYIDIFNEDLLDIDEIRKIVLTFKLNNNSLIASICRYITKNSNENPIIQKIGTNEDKRLVSLEENNTKEILSQIKKRNICNKFISSCINKEKLNPNSFILSLFDEINDVMFSNKNSYGNVNLAKEIIQNDDNIEVRNSEYVGLKNLSATCYMNSILQQLFMIHVLKYAILGIIDISQDNEILIQMQELFAYLNLSERQYYNPINLTKTNILNNRPIVVTIQQDSKEFYDSICDCLEKSLKNTKYKYIINDALMGCMLDSIQCESCGYTSNKFENFCDLSLEVKGVSDLEESLQKLIQEEKVNDFDCERCHKKVVIKKRITLSSIPNTLFFHLKRFNYEKDNPLVQKIFSKFIFPYNCKLNLKKYCTENFQEETDEIYPKKDEYYIYILKGVVQHSGNANGGHYISFIDVNRQGIENIMNENDERNKNKWMKFDDSSVSEFNLEDLPEETIGNADTTKTAYLLIYERLKKSPIKVVIKDYNSNENEHNIINFKKEEKNKINKKYDIYYKYSKIKEEDLYTKIFHNETSDEYYKYIPYYSIKKEIPRELKDKIDQDNQLIRKENNNKDDNNFLSNNDNNILENIFFNIIDSEDSLKGVQKSNINAKYNYITFIFSLIFKKINDSSITRESNYINSKLNNIKDFIEEIVSSKEEPNFEIILKLSQFLITIEKLDIIFIKDNTKDNNVFNTKNVGLIRKLVIKIIEKISKCRKNYPEALKEIERIAEVLINYYIYLKNNKAKDKLFNAFLLEVIKNDEIIIKILVENDFITKVLDNLENDKKLLVFDIIKNILKLTKEYHNEFSFNIEENKANYNINWPELKKEHKDLLGKRLLNQKPSLIKLMFQHNIELLMILTKILSKNEKTFLMKFFREYYRKCKCFMLSDKEDKIVDYFKIYFNLLDIQNENTLIALQTILGYPRLVIKTKNNINVMEHEENFYYRNEDLSEKARKESENLTLRDEIDKEIIENSKNIDYFGEQLIKDNNGYKNTYVYEYKNTYIIDERIIGFLNEIFNHESKLKGHKSELIYLLIDKCFQNNGNINLFKYLYSLPSRSIFYDNLFEELMEELDYEHKKKLSYINSKKNQFINIINNIPTDNPKQFNEHNLNLIYMSKFKGYISDFLPGELIKKEIQIVTQTEFYELIRIEYYTKNYSINDLRKKYNSQIVPNNNKNNMLNLNDNAIGEIEIEEEEEKDLDDFSLFSVNNNLNKDKNYLKKFKNGEKITIRFNNDKDENEEEMKTIISYIFVNKKPFSNYFSYTIKLRPDLPQEIKDNSFMIEKMIYFFIDARSYKLITYIQRKSLNSKFLENDDLVIKIEAHLADETNYKFFEENTD